MPRGGSRSAGSGRQRRMNWIGDLKVDTMESVAVNATETHELFAANWDAEVFSYVGPTLIRLRGAMQASGSGTLTNVGGDYLVRAYAAIWVGPTSTSVSTASEDAFWSSDRIIWQGSFFTRGLAFGGGTTSVGYGFNLSAEREIDVKAMRRLGDDGKLWVTFFNSASSTIPALFAWNLRALVKE